MENIIHVQVPLTERDIAALKRLTQQATTKGAIEVAVRRVLQPQEEK